MMWSFQVGNKRNKVVGISCLVEEQLISLLRGISYFTRCWTVICGVILCLQHKPEDSLEMMFTASLFPPLFLIPASLNTIMNV
jgi:hypothetical protein